MLMDMEPAAPACTPQFCLTPCHGRGFMLPRSYMIILQTRRAGVSFFSFVSFWPFCSLKDKSLTLMWCIFQESKNKRKIHLSSSKLQPWLKQGSCSSLRDCLKKGDFLLLATGLDDLNEPLPSSLAKKTQSSHILQLHSNVA